MYSTALFMCKLYISKPHVHENECVHLFVYFIMNLLFKQMSWTGTKNRMHKLFDVFPHFEYKTTEMQKEK